MNPFKKIQNYFIGGITSTTDDVFEKAKAEVLFNFTAFFFIANLPYAALSLTLTWFHIFLGYSTIVGLGLVFFILRKYKSIKIAATFYLLNHAMQNISHFLIDNGRLEMQGILFFLLFVLVGFMTLGRKWGFYIFIFVVIAICIGIYNIATNLSLFSFPPELADPVSEGFMQYLTLIPLILNVYLVSEFVKAQNNAGVQIRKQKILLEKNNDELEMQKQEIISSLNYAKRIQHAVLPMEETIFKNIPNAFIYYKPRDIVSGDFYWFHEVDKNNYTIVCADCTGHGVPGALMTVIGSNLLTQIVTEGKATSPSGILEELDEKITATLKQQKDHLQIIQDGMDLSLLTVNKTKKEFIFTSAKRPAILLRNGVLQEFKGSKNTLGGLRSGEKKFEEIKMNYHENDMIYLFTDGITDQFGGDKNKKLSIKRLRELLMNIHLLPVQEQKQKVDSKITNWVGKNEQTDDICLIGIKL